jgi:hypothetical protein
MTASRRKQKFINGIRQIDPDALRLWGKLRDFERQQDGACDPSQMFHLMTETMQRDTLRLLPSFLAYWRSMAQAVNGPRPPRDGGAA